MGIGEQAAGHWCWRLPLLEGGPLFPVKCFRPVPSRKQRYVALRRIKRKRARIGPGVRHDSRDQECRYAVEPEGNLGDGEPAIEAAVVHAHVGRVEILIERTVREISAARVAQVGPSHGRSLGEVSLTPGRLGIETMLRAGQSLKFLG